MTTAGPNCNRIGPSFAAGSTILAFFAVVVFSIHCGKGDIAFGEEGVSEEAAEAILETQMTRNEWQKRIAEAKNRAKYLRSTPSHQAQPSLEEPERIASERALNDESLHRGDIVSTDRGLLVFQGRSPDDPSRNVFWPYPSLK